MSGGKAGNDRLLSELDRRAGLSRRSPLFRWMREHYAEMAERLADAGGPRSVNWGAVAEVLGDGGLTGADGKPPSADVARKTWGKVVAMMGPARPGVVPALPRAPEARAAIPLPGSAQPVPGVDDQLERVRARLRSGTVPMPAKVER